jgi:hypothetical protein
MPVLNNRNILWIPKRLMPVCKIVEEGMSRAERRPALETAVGRGKS